MVASPAVGPGRVESTGARLRVVIASPALDAAGRALADPEPLLERYHALTGWAAAVADAGAAVTVVQRFGRDATARRREVDYRFVADGRAEGMQGWFRGARMADAVAAARPDVVHVQGMVFPLFTWMLRRRLGGQAAILVQDHGGLHAGSIGFRRRSWVAFHRLGLRQADGFLFTARQLANPWRRAGLVVDGQPVYEVPESSTDLAPPSVSPRRLDRLPGSPALLWVGRLDANKDPLAVLAGFERAQGAMRDATLTFVYGEDELLPEIRARLAASPELSRRVRLCGRIQRVELAEFYAAADLFVLGSHHEGSSFALIEALSFGLTPVVSDIPALRALTDDGRIGFLFPPGDPHGVATALEAAGRTDLDARRALVRAYFDRELSWPAVGRKALGCYRAAERRYAAGGSAARS